MSCSKLNWLLSRAGVLQGLPSPSLCGFSSLLSCICGFLPLPLSWDTLSLFFKKFYWEIVALQYCSGFCHTATGISHRYTYVPSLLNLPLTSHLPYPLGCHGALGWTPCVTEQMPTGCLFHTWEYICVCPTLWIHPVLSLPHCVRKPVLLCLRLHCCPADRFISTIFLDSTHLC